MRPGVASRPAQRGPAASWLHYRRGGGGQRRASAGRGRAVSAWQPPRSASASGAAPSCVVGVHSPAPPGSGVRVSVWAWVGPGAVTLGAGGNGWREGCRRPGPAALRSPPGCARPSRRGLGRLSREGYLQELSSETGSTHIPGSCYHCSLFVRNSPQCLREYGSHPRCCACLRPFPNLDPQFQEGIPGLVSPMGAGQALKT